MFGILGASGSAFINAAGRGGKATIADSILILRYAIANMRAIITCDGKIEIKSTKNGETVIEKYKDLNQSTVTIPSDANTNIEIKGALTRIAVHSEGPGINSITYIDASNCKYLTFADIAISNNVTSLDFGNIKTLKQVSINGTPTAIASINLNGCESLEGCDLRYCSNLQSLDLSSSALLNNLTISSSSITEIKYPATEQSVSTAIANAITAATAADGTVYTDSQGAYYSTIADAATAKGWTIEQLS